MEDNVLYLWRQRERHTIYEIYEQIDAEMMRVVGGTFAPTDVGAVFPIEDLGDLGSMERLV